MLLIQLESFKKELREEFGEVTEENRPKIAQ
jgi:hypothetical protein